MIMGAREEALKVFHEKCPRSKIINIREEHYPALRLTEIHIAYIRNGETKVFHYQSEEL